MSKHVVPKDKFKVTVPKIDESERVKPFTPSLEKSVGMTKQQAMKEFRDSAEATLKLLTDSSGLYPGDQTYDKMCKIFWKDHHKEMEKLKRRFDNVKSGTSDEKSQGQDTSTDTTKHTMASEKKSCKPLACMATPKKQSRITSIDSDSGSPTDYQSASEQNNGEQEYNSPSKSD